MQVEIGPQSLSIDRIGPFDTAAEAARALEIVEERAKKIREESNQEEEWD
jgi:hypothetical protein